MYSIVGEKHDRCHDAKPLPRSSPPSKLGEGWLWQTVALVASLFDLRVLFLGQRLDAHAHPLPVLGIAALHTPHDLLKIRRDLALLLFLFSRLQTDHDRVSFSTN
jgi:hypothetical protein